MILDKIRTAFPEINRTQEQDLLIGSTCLALTDKERNTINNLNFNNYESSLDENNRTDLSLKMAETVADAQWWGKTTGCVAGGAAGGAAGGYAGGAAAWYLSVVSPLWTGASVVGGAIGGALGGGYLGFQGGKIIGGKIGHKKAIKNVTNTSEFIRWQDEKYATVILPALSRYVEPDESTKKLICPLSFDWMKNPVRAGDGHVYEKSYIIAHLTAWRLRLLNMQEERQRYGQGPIPQQQMKELVRARSPLRNGNIKIEELEELPGYYKEEVRSLMFKYNMEVLKQRAIVYEANNEANNEAQELPEEASKVVRFYSMTQEQRNRIKTQMRRDLLNHRVFRLDEEEDEEEDEALAFLKAAATPPELIKFIV